MSNLFSKLFHRESGSKPRRSMDREYVSEHTRFINDFLEKHPEELVEQHDGRLLYWDRKVDLEAQVRSEKNTVPDNGYGFYFSGWGIRKH